MNFTISNKEYLKKVCGHILANYKDNTVINMACEDAPKLKTVKQLGFIFGGIVKSLQKYFESLGDCYSANTIKHWLYLNIGRYKLEQMPDGSEICVLITLSAMDKKQASEFINKLIAFVDFSPIFENASGARSFCLTPDLRYCWTHHVDGDMVQATHEEKFKERDEAYLRHIRGLNCIYCGTLGSEVHHIKQGSGLGRKNPDWFSVPLCNSCHTKNHSQIGEPELLRGLKSVLSGLDIETFCRLCYYRWLYHYGY